VTRLFPEAKLYEFYMRRTGSPFITFTPLSSIQDILLTKERVSQFITMTPSGGDTVSTQYGLENDDTQPFVNAAADAAKGANAAGIVPLKTNHLH